MIWKKKQVNYNAKNISKIPKSFYFINKKSSFVSAIFARFTNLFFGYLHYLILPIQLAMLVSGSFLLVFTKLSFLMSLHMISQKLAYLVSLIFYITLISGVTYTRNVFSSLFCQKTVVVFWSSYRVEDEIYEIQTGQ